MASTHADGFSSNELLFPPSDLTQSLFIVWSDAFDILGRVREDLNGSFNVLADVRVQWSKEHAQENICRLYGQPSLRDGYKNFGAKKISKPELHAFYVENPMVDASLHSSATGEIERLNKDFAIKKQLYRQWSQESNGGYPYLIHSAAQLDELRFQTVLLFGPERAKALWYRQKLEITELHQDLVGAGGWASLREVFVVLDHTVDWCVLRGWEGLPDNFSASDLDILVADWRRASAVLGLVHDQGNPSNIRNGQIILPNMEIKCDLHWTGDGYLDAIWQKNILLNRVIEKDVFRPNSEDAFFSLIYSEYVHRATERLEKVERIKRIGAELSHTGWLTDDLFGDRTQMLKVLAGYMKVSGYYWTPPVVDRYAQPQDAVDLLPKQITGAVRPSDPYLLQLAISLARRVLPSGLRRKLSKPVRRLFSFLK